MYKPKETIKGGKNVFKFDRSLNSTIVEVGINRNKIEKFSCSINSPFDGFFFVIEPDNLCLSNIKIVEHYQFLSYVRLIRCSIKWNLFN
jgi:hypothetical protein